MKTQRFGIEIEMTGITRAKAAEVALRFFGSTARLQHLGGTYDEYRVTTVDGRYWKFVSDGSILPRKKVNGQLIAADKDYSVELVSPILKYEDVENLQELVRQLRHAGAISDSKYKCGIHIHVDAKNHTPTSLKNVINLMVSKEELMYKSLEIDPERLRYCKKVNENLLSTINRKKPKTIEALADIWYEGYGREAETGITTTADTMGSTCTVFLIKERLSSDFLTGRFTQEKIRAYLVLCLAISHQALTQKTASPRRTFIDNEKYTFRCWMLRLGLIGDEFKNCREHLMANLTGNSAWRNVA